MSDVSIVRCWPEASSEVTAAVQAMWARSGVVDEEASAERSSQIVTAALLGDRAVGVATAEVLTLPRLGVPMFHYRTFVDSGQRDQGVAAELFFESFRQLRDHSKAAPEGAPLGVLTIFQTSRFHGDPMGALPVIPIDGLEGATMVYLGLSPKGHRMRATWFGHARIPEDLGYT